MRRGSSGLNLLLGINKPVGMTSHDVVDIVRRALGERRVGHAGTLDPAAEGVMVIGVGQGTRLMGLLTADSKSYLATVRFGYETNTDDGEGEVTKTSPLTESLSDANYARNMLQGLLGEQEQVPPAYSAISVGGKRAYARARSGEEVVLEPRRVQVLEAQLISIDSGTLEAPAEGARNEVATLDWQCAFTVSKGTYIRAIARDMGRAAGGAAHLARLCRTVSGTVTLAQCVSLERVRELGAKGVGGIALDPARSLGLPVRRLGDSELSDVTCGRMLDAGGVRRGKRVALVHDSRLLGVWESTGTRLMAKANFPQGIEGVRA